MLQRLVGWLSTRSFRQTLCAGAVAAVAMEAFTCALRFGTGMTAGESTHWMAGVTFGWRIHHGYVGAAVILAALLFRTPWVRNALLITGVGLFVSDALHHFAVLWPITGSPEFYVRYPD
jgi:hypothetical protein